MHAITCSSCLARSAKVKCCYVQRPCSFIGGEGIDA